MSGRLAFDEHGFRDKYSLGVYSVSLENGPTKVSFNNVWGGGGGFVVGFCFVYFVYLYVVGFSCFFSFFWLLFV